jgi:geranylgeranylglycerol-phosphate geranylgeranyltransferase
MRQPPPVAAANASEARRLLRGLYRLGHPLPTFATAAATTLFVATAAGGPAPATDLLVTFLAFYLLLYSIGAMNDYCDEAVDRRSGRVDKPLAAGDVPRSVALVAWLAAAAGAMAAASYFGAAAAAMMLPLWLAGAAYNFWAKATIVSWLPFVFFYPSLPVWAFLAEGRLRPTLLMIYPIGALLAAALNIANTLPDVERDRRAGVAGLTQRLGVSRGLRLLWLLLGATLVLMTATLWAGYNDASVLGVGLAAGVALLGVIIADGLLVGDPSSLQRSYYLSIVYAIGLAYAWIASLF